ncbi:MAG: hypothetical protein K0M45_07280 [Candidatus Paracaedibacteraceae bacterium]|nr:hypothetical protein [Candidatus Paracaedibacteraceae bacterium]
MATIIDFPKPTPEFPVLFFLNAQEYKEILKANEQLSIEEVLDIEVLTAANRNDF